MDRPHIDWARLAGDRAELVRPETRSKYFPKNSLRQALISRFLARVADGLSGFEWRTLLDVGAGEGFVDYYLSRVFPGRSIIGIEPGEDARLVASHVNPDFCYLGGDGRRLPFADRSFDAVICLEVLEHIVDYRRVMEEMRRVSRGPCLISVPAWPWYQGTNFLLGKNWSRFGEHPDHVIGFTRSKLLHDMREVFGESTAALSYPWRIAVYSGPAVRE